MSKNNITVEAASHINNTVNAVVAMVATSPKAVRATNRAYRPVLISAAYAMKARNGHVTADGLYTVVRGATVERIKATVKSIRKDISAVKVAANTAKVIALAEASKIENAA
jgi:uncharacterized membrane protein